MTDLILDSPIDHGSRGRNGWFTARWLRLRGEQTRQGYLTDAVEITVHSQREGRSEPIVLRLAVDDARRLIDALEAEIARGSLADAAPR